MDFRLTIYSNVPGDPSMPDSSLWSQTFPPGEYEVHLKADNNPEDFYDHAFGPWLDDNHLEVYQFDFYIDSGDASVQDSGTIYRLSLIGTAAQHHRGRG